MIKEIIRNNWVIGDTYEVKQVGPVQIRYSEGDKHLLIYWEGLTDKKNVTRIAFYVNNIHEWNVPLGEKIDSDKLEKIKENLYESLTVGGDRIEFR